MVHTTTGAIDIALIDRGVAFRAYFASGDVDARILPYMTIFTRAEYGAEDVGVFTAYVDNGGM